MIKRLRFIGIFIIVLSILPGGCALFMGFEGTSFFVLIIDLVLACVGYGFWCTSDLLEDLYKQNHNFGKDIKESKKNKNHSHSYL